MACVVASDLGSSACKTVVVDDRGRVLSEATREYPTHRPQPGWSEQDPHDWLNATLETAGLAVAAAGVRPRDVVVYSICGVTHNAVLADGRGRPLRPTVTLFDERCVAQCESIERRFGEDVARQAGNAVSPMWTWPQLSWLREHEPQVLGEARAILFQKDWVRQQLAPSAPLTDPIDAAGSLLFDPVAGHWIDEFVADAGLVAGSLPGLAAPTEVAGGLQADAAVRMGLATGTPVIVGTTDTAAEILGAGAVEPGHGTIKLASVGRIASIASAPSSDPRVLNYRHVLDGLWYPGTACKFAASAFHWLRETIGHSASFEEMTAAAAGSPAGARGVLFLPHLGGQWAPFWDAGRRGAFVGLDSAHSRGDLCRAVLEGVAFALRDAVAFAHGAGLRFDELRLIGGGATSPLWSQILADVLGIPLAVPAQRSAAWGAAVLGGMAVGMFPRDSRALRTMAVVQACYEPDPGRARAYDDLHALYRQADDALLPLSRGLASWRATHEAAVRALAASGSAR